MDEKERNEATDGENKKKKQKKLLLFLAVFLVVFAAVFGILELINRQNTTPPEDTGGQAQVQTDGGTVENPIDFDALCEGNDEIYAWLKVEDTNVDHPIVQSDTNDEFYLRHKAEDKTWSASGAIYTEMGNTKTFADPVTVIYGHNGYGDTMFTTLHYFEDGDFFESHPYFYIYMPQRRLTYQVVSAFKYDDRHILNAFDFTKPEDLAEFQQTVCNPTSSQKQVRQDLDVAVDENSKLVVLSTCITNQKSSRYLVCGVLVNDEKTD